MQELDFSLDGTDASSKGIYLQRPITFTAAVRRTSSITVPGRNGTLHVDNGAYNSRIAQASCYAVDSSDVTGDMADIMAFLFSSENYRILKVSDDTNHYWKAYVLNGGEIAARLSKLNPFTIQFECEPFRYVNGAETFVAVTSQTVLANPTQFNAYPLLKVVATGEGTIENTTGSIDVLVSGGSRTIYIDCEDYRAYTGDGESVDYLISADEFPYLIPGNSGFTITGNLTLEVAPRWRTL